MNITVLGQGYEPVSEKSVGNMLMKFLGQTNFHTFTGIAAFASLAGISGISGYIERAKSNFKFLNLIVGVDQEGTSKEALNEILEMDVNSYIFYQSEPPIFHPKIYLFEGDHEIKIIVGSSNLTGRGLFVNIEGSLLLEFTDADSAGTQLLNDLKEYYTGLFNFTDSNLFKITSEVIDSFVSKGIVPNETERSLKYSQIKANQQLQNNIGIEIPRRKAAQIPKHFRKAKKRNPISPDGKLSVGSQFRPSELLWQSGPLTPRDLNIPKGATTNATGSMLFKKGLQKNIDQKHYFRDTVFSSLLWAKDKIQAKSHLERAVAIFIIIIDNNNYGDFKLNLTHNSKTDSKAYQQNNSMTQISWGEAKSIIAKDELIGKTASLFSVEDFDDIFILDIQ
ncbi:MAG: phospholipase D family protein [Taibaiella sp.]|nr:phospholipase D family protein [Taibaiella sp.]